MVQPAYFEEQPTQLQGPVTLRQGTSYSTGTPSQIVIEKRCEVLVYILFTFDSCIIYVHVVVHLPSEV